MKMMVKIQKLMEKVPNSTDEDPFTKSVLPIKIDDKDLPF